MPHLPDSEQDFLDRYYLGWTVVAADDHQDGILVWLVSRLGESACLGQRGRWQHYQTNRFVFLDSREAMMFKLTWGGGPVSG